MNSGTGMITPREDRMVLAPICISTARWMPVSPKRQASDTRRSGPRPYAGGRVPGPSSQPRGARAPGAPAAGAGAPTHRGVGGAHGQDVWRASTPGRGDPAQLVRLAGAARDRVAVDGARRDARAGP